jgi:DNA-binding Lrp family transcriptional regulator
MSHNLTTRNRLILNRIQSNFPLVSAPYAQIGQELGLTEQEVQAPIKQLKRNKIIRRIGAIFDTPKLGFVSALVGLIVDSHRIEQVGKQIAQYDEVTHCYARAHQFNLWFTLTCKSKKEMNTILSQTKKIAGIEKMLYLPAVKTFKIRAEFKLD